MPKPLPPEPLAVRLRRGGWRRSRQRVGGYTSPAIKSRAASPNMVATPAAPLQCPGLAVGHADRADPHPAGDLVLQVDERGAAREAAFTSWNPAADAMCR